VIDLVREKVRANPHATAVTCRGRSWTYVELDARARAIAAFLRSRGVGPEVCVGVCVERSLEMVAALLGVLYARGAYLPLDTAHPSSLLSFLIDDGAISTVLTSHARRDELSELARLRQGVHFACVEDLGAPTGDEIALDAEGDLADRLVYVLYTSGSTGRPKGVAMTRGPLMNLLRWQRQSSSRNWAKAARTDATRLTQTERTLQFTPLTFDVSFLEIFSTLASGGTIVVPVEEERRDMAALLDLVIEQRVSSVFLPLVVLNHLAEVGLRTKTFPSSLYEIKTGGEQLRISPAIEGWFARMPHCTLENIYGPTEAHVVTALELDGDPRSWPRLPGIGHPIPGADIHLLDRDSNHVPDGEVGEIFIGGACLARGYLNRPDLDAQSFIASPFGAGRLYRSGDLAHRLPDGSLMYDGRTDDQVKIRGVRVEPSEIESVLEKHPEVRACSVVARGDVAGEKRLVAYIVPSSAPSEPQTQQMAAKWYGFLSERLPSHQVPTTYVTLPALPLTTSGKVDRRALPAPSTTRPHLAVPLATPVTETERRLARIWAELLQLEPVGIDDGFFDLGGHSLLLTHMQHRVAVACGREVPIVVLLQNPTVRSLAAYLDRGSDGVIDAPTRADGDARRSGARRRRHA
jgi:amino acid adenylation domain-containing protein